MPDYYEQIKSLEDEIKKTQYNKKTQHHIGLVKAKIAKLKEKDEARRTKKGSSKGYAVKKSGDATVIIVGFPSSGKSTLLNSLTDANSPVGAYEFTTLHVIPGTLNYRDAKIQILDVPGVVYGAAAGRGRGKEVLAVVQNADLVIILIDVLRPNALSVLQKEIYDSHIRLNQQKPDVKIRKTMRGGIRIGKTVKLEMSNETITAILKEFRINNGDILIRSFINADQLIDVVEGNKKYIPGIIILNKIDIVDEKKLSEIKSIYKPDICISAEEKININELKELIFQKLRFIRVYCKEVGKKADMNVPMILKEGDTLETMCRKLHRDFVDKFKFARIWGKSVKFEGQKILKPEHKLEDKDIVELHIS